MRPNRISFKLGGTRKRVPSGRRSLKQHFENTLLKVMILGTVLLAVFQFNTSTDPVEFYLKLAGDLDYPAFKYDEVSGEKKDGLISLEFQTEPVSQVIVKQNDKILGEVGNGIKLEVEPGTVFLDATKIQYPVTVTVILNQKSHKIELNQDIKSFNIQMSENK